MSQFGFAEKPQRAKNGRTNGARIFPSTARRAELRLGRGMSPPEEIAGYVTVRICGETAAGEKERANEWCEDFSKYRKAGGAAVGRGMSPPAGEKRRCHVHLPAGAPA